ncbi:MAG: DUF2797 domain-containing protein, partial [Flavobacteriaceae bacterium]
RYLAGVGEVALKEHFSDKTNWRKMLQNQAEPIQWEVERNKALDFIPKELKPFIISEAKEAWDLEFPVLKYPEKVKSLNLTKTPLYVGKLCGIKGQYLIFEDQTVFNVRSNEGQCIQLEVKN